MARPLLLLPAHANDNTLINNELCRWVDSGQDIPVLVNYQTAFAYHSANRAMDQN